ncbi:MAG: NAD-dependent epimerase/dehydratase family protein [Planctomycetota bacterium]
MSERVIITGVCGFLGRHLCDYLARLPDRPELIGVDVAATPPAHCDAFHQMDLSLATDVAERIKAIQPDVIIHLAGTFGEADPLETYRVSVFSLAVLLEAARLYVPGVVVVATGSAAEYGRVAPEQLPVTEQTPCRPLTPYGLSKQLATEIALYYHRVYRVCAMVVRPFQLLGKGITARLAPGAFAEELKRARATGSGVIQVGNLESSRDFLDVRDAAEAIWRLCRKPAGGEVFNLCSGRPTRMAELLQAMIACCGIEVRIEVDRARLRGEADVSVIYGSYAKLNAHCGWQPRTDLDRSIKDTACG